MAGIRGCHASPANSACPQLEDLLSPLDWMADPALVITRPRVHRRRTHGPRTHDHEAQRRGRAPWLCANISSHANADNPRDPGKLNYLAYAYKNAESRAPRGAVKHSISRYSASRKRASSSACAGGRRRPDPSPRPPAALQRFRENELLLRAGDRQLMNSTTRSPPCANRSFGAPR